MPLEDAISLLARNFDAYLLREKASRPSEVSVVPATGPLTAINLTDRHPEAIQVSTYTFNQILYRKSQINRSNYPTVCLILLRCVDCINLRYYYL